MGLAASRAAEFGVSARHSGEGFDLDNGTRRNLGLGDGAANHNVKFHGNDLTGKQAKRIRTNVGRRVASLVYAGKRLQERSPNAVAARTRAVGPVSHPLAVQRRRHRDTLMTSINCHA
jgi:hypothetical protein